MKKLIIIFAVLFLTVPAFARVGLYGNPVPIVISSTRNDPILIKLFGIDNEVFSETEIDAITKVEVKYIPASGEDSESTDSVACSDCFDTDTWAEFGEISVDIANVAFTVGRDRSAELIIYTASWPLGYVIATLDIKIDGNAIRDATMIDPLVTVISLDDLSDVSTSSAVIGQFLKKTGTTTYAFDDVTPGAIEDDVYGAGWNGDAVNAPSQNAVYDKIEGLAGGHDAVTIGTANGLTLSTQALSLAAATNSTPGAASAAHITALEANTAKVTDDDIGVAEVYDDTGWNGDTASPQKNDVRDKINTMDTAIGLNTAKTIDDTAYNATSWDANTDAPSKNAVRDKIESLGAGPVEDDVYGAGWNGDASNSPSQNAVYDKIDSMDTAISLNTAKATNPLGASIGASEVDADIATQAELDQKSTDDRAYADTNDDVGILSTAIDSFAEFISQFGIAGTPDGTKFLRDDGVFATPTGATGMTDIVEDTTPQLGGNLDIQAFNIEGVDATEFSYIDPTSSIQGQLDGKQSSMGADDNYLTDAQLAALLAIDTETELEALLELQDFQGAVTDAQVPNDITINGLSGTNNGDTALGFESLTDPGVARALSIVGGVLGWLDYSSLIGMDDVTYENLNANGDVGTTAGSVAAGDHNHSGIYEPAFDFGTTLSDINTQDIPIRRISLTGTQSISAADATRTTFENSGQTATAIYDFATVTGVEWVHFDFGTAENVTFDLNSANYFMLDNKGSVSILSTGDSVDITGITQGDFCNIYASKWASTWYLKLIYSGAGDAVDGN